MGRTYPDEPFSFYEDTLAVREPRHAGPVGGRGCNVSQQPTANPRDGVGAEAQAAIIAAELPDSYFEIYKIAVEMADRMSARRGLANSFFLTINTTVLGILGTHEASWYLAVAGIILCGSWWALLKSYRDLNRAKFGVILAMEEKLPARLYGDEWNRLRREPVPFTPHLAALRPWMAQYRELGVVERIVPWVFVLVYVAEIVRQLIR